MCIHTHNFDSISAAEEIIHIKPWCLIEMYVHMFLVHAQILTHITCMNKNDAHIICINKNEAHM